MNNHGNLAGMLVNSLAIESANGTITVVPKGVQVMVSMNDNSYSDISEADMLDAAKLLNSFNQLEAV